MSKSEVRGAELLRHRANPYLRDKKILNKLSELKEDARRFLIKAGIFNEDGTLNENYQQLADWSYEDVCNSQDS